MGSGQVNICIEPTGVTLLAGKQIAIFNQASLTRIDFAYYIF